MDGNGRWATSRGLPLLAGHRRGTDAVRRTVEAAPGCGIGVLTLYAFSSDNWSRPKEEVGGIMDLFRHYLLRERRRCIENGVRVSVIGRRDRLSTPIIDAIESIEQSTRECARLHLRIAVDYSSRDCLLAAMKTCSTREEVTDALGPDVDLLIRTSGEQRLSDFLLWECAYAEMVFTPRMWPTFTGQDLAEAVDAFHRRDRRFGRVASAIDENDARRTA